MKKVKIGRISILSLSLLAGCSGGKTSENDTGTLNVILYDAGWGSEWL